MKEPEKTIVSLNYIRDYSLNDKAVEHIEKLKARFEQQFVKDTDNRHKQHGNVMHAKVSGLMTKEEEENVKKLHQSADELRHEKYIEEAKNLLKENDPEAYKEYLQDQDRIKGTNQGYQLSKNEPELSKQLMENIRDVSTPFVDGYKKGRENYFGEKMQKQLEQYKERQKTTSLDLTKNKVKDKDKDIEL